MAVAVCGMLYWLLSAPLMRYGLATILIALSVMAGTVLSDTKRVGQMAVLLGVFTLLYVPVEGDQGGYDIFPETPYYSDEFVRMRGDSFGDGFIGSGF